MLMSMFSSFDALCAESFGQKVGFSWASGKEGKEKTFVVSDRKEASSSIEGMKKVKEGIPSKPPSDGEKSSNKRQQRRPRFAPELDGVHCFETIVLY